MTTAAAVAVSNGKNGSEVPPPSTTPPKFVASQLLPIDAIEPDPENPRKDFPKEKMNELISSVMLLGVREPIEVRPLSPAGAKPVAGVVGLKYRITFGERRWRAAKAAGLKEIPAIVRPMTELEAAEVQLAENLKRADLSALEVAGGYQRQLELGRTIEQVCERAGKKRTQVYSTLQLLQLGPEGRKALGEERLNAEVAKLVARLPKALQPRFVKECAGEEETRYFEAKGEPLTYREALEAFAGYTRDLRKAPWKLTDEGLPCVAKSCAVCPKRTGNATDLYPDAKNPYTCTDAPGYDGKLRALRQREVAAKGGRLLSEKEAPTDELFWNYGHHNLRPDCGYVMPDDTCRDDARNRSYRDLLDEESLKKLQVYALSPAGDVVELLDQAGLKKALAKCGRVVSWEQRRKEQEKKQKEKAAEKEKAGPSLDEAVRDAVMESCVAAIEEKGLLTSPMQKLIARRLLSTLNWESRLAQRRGLANGLVLDDSRRFETAFPKLTPGKLAGLLFEAALDELFEVGDPEDWETLALDACELLGVDPRKVAEAVKLQRGMTEQRERGEAFAADVKASMKKLAAAKKTAKLAKAKKGGGKK